MLQLIITTLLASVSTHHIPHIDALSLVIGHFDCPHLHRPIPLTVVDTLDDVKDAGLLVQEPHVADGPGLTQTNSIILINEFKGGPALHQH